MAQEFEVRYRAVERRDPRFDGVFFTAVRTTRVYCRPSCPTRTPKAENVRFFTTAAGAQVAGYRSCKRCRPDAAPGSPEWDRRADLVGRSMRLIGDGVVDRDGVVGLAARVGFSPRHVHRALVEALGAGPLALARARRAQTARVLLETTELAVTEVAFAAGFASVRQFNATIREVFDRAPGELRGRAGWARDPAGDDAVSLRLAYRAPIDVAGLLGFLGARAVPGVEELTAEGVFRRSLRLPHGPAVVELVPGDAHVEARIALEDLRDLAVAARRCRDLLDLDCDPRGIDELLGGDPLLAPLVDRTPGRRVPGSVDGPELAVRALLSRETSVAAARGIGARLVADHGEPLPRPVGGVTHLFPAPATLAALDPSTLPVPTIRGRALVAVAGAVADGRLVLDRGADRADTAGGLRRLPGVGPWTAEYVAMHALGDPDAFPGTDPVVRRGLHRLGLHDTTDDRTQRWRPYRAYAAQHLRAARTP